MEEAQAAGCKIEAQYKYGLCKGADKKKAVIKNGFYAEGTQCGRIFCDKEWFRFDSFPFTIFFTCELFRRTSLFGNLRTKTRHSTDFYGNQMHRRQLAFAKMAVATGANRPRFVLLVSNHSHFHILYN